MINIGQTYNERYTVKKGLGRGGFATVYLAHDSLKLGTVKPLLITGGEDGRVTLWRLAQESTSR
jgi:serine/threonine protein kinase